MKYDQDSALCEILRRSDILQKKKEQVRVNVLCASSTSAFALLVLSIGILSRKASLDQGQTAFGAFLLPSNAGGYVLAAVIAFIAGVVVTLLIYRNQEKKKQEDKKNSNKLSTRQEKTDADETETAFAAEASINGDRWIER